MADEIIESTSSPEPSNEFAALADQVLENDPTAPAPSTEQPGATTEGGEKPPTTEKPAGEAAPEAPKGDEGNAPAPVTQPPAATKPEAAKPAAVREDKELDAIKPPQHISPRSMGNWNSLRQLAAKRGDELETLRTENAQLKQRTAQGDPALTKNFGSLEQEVNAYRALYKSERSPEFVAKYDEPIQAHNTSGLEILKKFGLPEDSLKKITDLGGIHKVPGKTMAEWIAAVGKNDPVASEKLRAAYVGINNLNEE